MALDLARLGLGRTSPNPAVGCVITKGNKVLSVGFHKRAGMAHAEIEALGQLKDKGIRGKGVRLYVNLEPCCFQGRTPPCTDAIIRSGIRRVVIGMRDPDPHVKGRGVRVLKKAGIRVRVGILEQECRDLNQAYIVHRTKKRPFVILKMAVTLDGKIGLKGRGGVHAPLRITGKEAMQFSHRLRNEVDAILVGSGTIRCDNPRLTTRLRGGRGRDPLRVVLDTDLSVSPSARVFTSGSPAPTWIATAAKGERERNFLLCRRGADGRIDLRDLLKKLARRGVMTLLVEGGRQVWDSFLRRKLIDSLFLFVSPRVLGKGGVPAPLEAKKFPFPPMVCQTVGKDLLIQYSP